MSATTFRPIKLRSSTTGATVEGELVLSHSLHYQVAVDGIVRAFPTSEWSEAMDFSDVFGSAFKGFWS